MLVKGGMFGKSTFNVESRRVKESRAIGPKMLIMICCLTPGLQFNSEDFRL